jgi:antiviral helicase SKI2
MDLLVALQRYNFQLVRQEFVPRLFRPLQQTLGHHKGLDIDIQKGIIFIDQLRDCLKTRNYFDTYPNFLNQFREVFLYMRLVDEKNNLEYLMSPRSLRLHEEYQARIAVLQKLGYIDSENLVQLKGRVACEMGNQNELMVTELIFNNVLSDCPPVEVAALLSCMVFEAKNVPEPKLMPDARLKQKVEDIKELARTIGTVQRECGVSESIDGYVEQFKFGLVEVVYEWAQGKPFANIMNLTEVQEGLIVRTIQRLDEMLKDVKDAARIIGDPTLKKKMEEASECIKRDIVFAASLYTQ